MGAAKRKKNRAREKPVCGFQDKLSPKSTVSRRPQKRVSISQVSMSGDHAERALLLDDEGEADPLEKIGLNNSKRSSGYSLGSRVKAQLLVILRPALTEFFATAMFVMIGVTAVRNNSTNSGEADLVAVALAHGFMIVLLVAMTAHVRYGDG